VRTIAVINQKGGVGKTTTVANLGAAIAIRHRKVCLLDLDPQAHLTLHLGIEPGTTDVSTYDVLISDAHLRAAAMRVAERLWLIPSEIDLAAAEIELVSTVGREQLLRDRLVASRFDHDFLFVDCPPSLGLLTLNALAAADDVIIPLQPHFLALHGLGKLLETVSLVRRRINPQLRVSGVILCMYETTTRLASEVVADLKGFFSAARGGDTPWSRTRIFETVIRRNIKLAECPSHGLTIFDYEPGSNGAADYGALADEFLTCFDAPEREAGPALAARPFAQGAGGLAPFSQQSAAEADEVPTHTEDATVPQAASAQSVETDPSAPRPLAVTGPEETSDPPPAGPPREP